jgi:uncharacterized RDD family membrane protein YckC
METTMPPVQTLPKEPQISSPVLATRGTRLLAAIVDTAAALVVYLVSIFLSEPILLFVGIIGLAIYQIYLLTTLGQSIGKKLMNVKIVRCDTGENGGFMTNVGLRMVLNSIIGFIPFYALVDVLFIFRQDQRCIHDMIAGTKVVEA